MEVYIVITNGEVNGEVEGAYSTYEKAKEKFEEVKQNWLDYAHDDCTVWEDDHNDVWSIIDHVSDEYLEVKIERAIIK